jgi:hypothetical protein
MADEITTQATPPPATEGLSPAEQRYFDSKGADVPGERDPSTPAQAEAPAATDPPKAQEPATPPTEPAKQFVEKGALDSERNRRKKAEAALEQLNNRFASLEARLAPQPQQQPQPTVDEDPVAEVKRLREWRDSIQQAQQTEATIVDVLQRSDAAEREYAAEVPDYNDALDYLRGRLVEQYKLAGMPQHLAIQAMKRQAAETAHMAFQRGMNPGELFYAYAKTYGWQGKAPASPAPAAPPAPTAPPASQQNIAQEMLAMLKSGQQASASLSAAPGRSADGTSLAEIAELEGDDFLRAWGRVEKQQRAGRA